VSNPLRDRGDCLESYFVVGFGKFEGELLLPRGKAGIKSTERGIVNSFQHTFCLYVKRAGRTKGVGKLIAERD